MQNFEEKYEGQTIPELASALRKAKEAHDASKAESAQLYKEIEFLAKTKLPEVMEEQGIDNIKVKDVGRISLRGDAYCSVVKGRKEALLEWLRENDFEDLIQEGVNSSTLKAFIKEQINEGNEIPNEDIVNFTPYIMASLTKA